MKRALIIAMLWITGCPQDGAEPPASAPVEEQQTIERSAEEAGPEEAAPPETPNSNASQTAGSPTDVIEDEPGGSGQGAAVTSPAPPDSPGTVEDEPDHKPPSPALKRNRAPSLMPERFGD